MTETDDASVPPDFPTAPLLAALAGAQPKLPARLVDGQYVVGLRPEELQARFALCEDLVTQLVPYCLRKQTERPEWSQEDLLAKVAEATRAKAAAGKEGWDLSESELQWVLAKVGTRLKDSDKRTR